MRMPRTAPRVLLLRFTIESQMKLYFAGATHAGQIRVREQIFHFNNNFILKVN
jgi:hypothetical protein